MNEIVLHPTTSSQPHPCSEPPPEAEPSIPPQLSHEAFTSPSVETCQRSPLESPSSEQSAHNSLQPDTDAPLAASNERFVPADASFSVGGDTPPRSTDPEEVRDTSPPPSMAESEPICLDEEPSAALLELADALDRDEDGDEDGEAGANLCELDEEDGDPPLALEQQLPAKSKHREVLDEHNSKLFREDPRMDRRIIEGMLNDRSMFLEEMIGEGYSSSAVLRRAAELGLSEALIRQVKGVAADLAGERPGRRPAPSSLGARTCLSCDRVFLSSGPGNRLCMRCRGGDAGLAQL